MVNALHRAGLLAWTPSGSLTTQHNASGENRSFLSTPAFSYRVRAGVDKKTENKS